MASARSYGPYSLIYADPPWPFGVWNVNKCRRHVSYHYSVMTLPQIAALPVADLAARDAALLLWVTMPNLPDCIDVMRAWGFQFKTCAFSWVKINKANGKPRLGLGFYTRANNELCLLGIRGKPLKRQSRSVEQMVIEPMREHSRKPDCVRDRIVELFGDIPRVELFARQRVAGWDVALSNDPDHFSDLWTPQQEEQSA